MKTLFAIDRIVVSADTLDEPLARLRAAGVKVLSGTPAGRAPRH